MTTLNIKEKLFGTNKSTFIIAEAGSNFRISEDPDVNFQHALKLIDIASEAKADSVKFQVYKASKLYVKKAGYADYLGKKKEIFDIIKEMELPYEWIPKLKAYCDKKNILFSATPFDVKSTDELEKSGVAFYKLASYSITDFPLLKHVAEKGKPLLLSTGASSIEDITEAVQYIKKFENDQIILLQCTAKYPTPLDSVNLRTIKTLQEKLDMQIGLSDHSRDPFIAPVGAVALGAKVLEKHFTTDNNLPGPDHSFAILPDELKEMVLQIRKMEVALGDGEKDILPSEKELYGFARHFIYSIKQINKGEKFTRKNIDTLRSGKMNHGLEPKYFEEIIGKKALIDISEQTPIKLEMVDGVKL